SFSADLGREERCSTRHLRLACPEHNFRVSSEPLSTDRKPRMVRPLPVSGRRGPQQSDFCLKSGPCRGAVASTARPWLEIRRAGSARRPYAPVRLPSDELAPLVL